MGAFEAKLVRRDGLPRERPRKTAALPALARPVVPSRSSKEAVQAGRSRKQRRRNLSLRCLLERVRELDELRLTARGAGETHVVWRRLGFKARRKGVRPGTAGHGNEAKWYGDRWVAGARRDAGAAHAGEEQCVEPVRLQRG